MGYSLASKMESSWVHWCSLNWFYSDSGRSNNRFGHRDNFHGSVWWSISWCSFNNCIKPFRSSSVRNSSQCSVYNGMEISRRLISNLLRCHVFQVYKLIDSYLVQQQYNVRQHCFPFFSLHGSFDLR